MNKESRHKHKILIVDDDDDILSLLYRGLTDAGFEVIKSDSGEDALTKLATVSPSLVITDLFMDKISGMDLLSHIHNDDPLLPVIILSGKANIPDAVKATHLGSAAFLTKPVDQKDLLANVDRYLRINPDKSRQQIFSEKLIYQSKLMSAMV